MVTGWRGFFITMQIDPRLYSKILRDKRLSLGAFKLWHLFREMTGKNDCCWPSSRTIAKTIHVSKDSVDRWISELEYVGYLTVERGSRNRPNRYSLAPTIRATPDRIAPMVRAVAPTISPAIAPMVHTELNSVIHSKECTPSSDLPRGEGLELNPSVPQWKTDLERLKANDFRTL
jgi:DNA-binding MarR family transcriptional regulator